MDWAVSPTQESALLFAACWMCNLNGALPAFLLRGKRSLWAPLAAAVTIPVLMVIVRPEWATHPLVPAVFVTTVSITLATRIGLSYLAGYADGVDAEARQLERATASLATRKAATYQAAEDARVLHDTAINTLGAIANGGSALADTRAVRRRCLADVQAIQALRSASGENAAEGHHGFREAIRPLGIKLKFTGMADDELARTEALLPANVVRDFSRIVAEAVQNSAKHSGADEVTVMFARTFEGVRVMISDEGVGIQSGVRRGGGIERSIIERAQKAGIQVSINSVPEEGTTVTLDYAFDDANDQGGDFETDDKSVDGLVRQLRSRAVFALSAGLVGVGVALSALNHPGEATPEWLMVAVVAVACWLAWRERDRAQLSLAIAFVLGMAGPLAFTLSAWSVGFGRVDPTLWQAIAPTGPLLALVIMPTSNFIRVSGFMAYAVAVGVLAFMVSPSSTEAAAVSVVAGLLGLGLVVVVLSFVRSLADVAARAHDEQRAAFAANLELATVEAASESRSRWRAAGIEESVTLLQAIGDGKMNPRDPAIREKCAEEEAFLRQLSLLNPGLIRMGTWFSRALNISRQRGVGLTVRAGAADATVKDARQFGQILLSVVDVIPPGSKLTTALFATARGLTMTMVAPTPHLTSALRGSFVELGAGCKLRTLGAQDFVEFIGVDGWEA